MRWPSVPEEAFRTAAIRTCKAINGREGCRCADREGQYCESMGSVWGVMFYEANVDQERIVALINGRASIRMKPR